MTALTTVSTFRRALIKAGIDTTGLNASQIEAEYLKLGLNNEAAQKIDDATIEVEKPKLTAVPKPSTTIQAGDAAAQLHAALSALMASQTAPVDENRIVELIQKHANAPRAIEIIKKETREITARIESPHINLDDVLLSLECGNSVYLYGAAGSGKTTLASHAAACLGLPFYSTGAVMAAYELLGVKDAHGNYHSTPLREAWENGGVFLFDEIDGCSKKAILAINRMLAANGAFTFPDGQTVERHPDFLVIAAANTAGDGATRFYQGRESLDKASLDRFEFIRVDYDLNLERDAAFEAFKQYGGENENAFNNFLQTVRDYRAAVDALGIVHIISPRASIMGARLLAKGRTLQKIIEGVLVKGLSEDQRKLIENHVKNN